MEDLSTKTRDELLAVAEELNIKVHHKAKEDTIIKQIQQQPQAFIADAMKHKAEQPVAKGNHNTPDAIREVLAKFISKEGFQLSFDEQEGTFHMAYKGAEECMNMSVPLRVIAQKAENVARGRISPRGLGRDGTYGQSYADTILSC